MLAPSHARDLSIPSDLAAARRVQSDIECALRDFRFGDHDIFGVKLALEEALVNAIKHGNRLDPAKQVHIHYSVSSDRFDIHIRDEGPGFDPECVPDPTAPENLERPCGRGLLLMRHYMTEVNYADAGRAVRMCKLPGRK
jgi:serine/threonine-protein kinase RsbW